MKQTDLWVEKYRPIQPQDYVYQSQEQQKAFLKMIVAESIPNLLLYGTQGTGKTTMAQIIIDNMPVDQTDVLTINASETNSVEMIRNDIKDHIQAFSFGEFKIIHLQEADYLSQSAQATLRVMMEEFSHNARFIMTCNYRNKIIPALQSRCQEYEFVAAPKESIYKRVESILTSEQVKADTDTINKCIDAGYPDIRKIIQIAQQHTNESNELVFDNNVASVKDFQVDLLAALQNKSWQKARDIIKTEVSDDQWISVYQMLIDNIDKISHPNVDGAIIAISDHLYKHNTHACPEMNCTALLIKLSKPELL